LSSRVVRVVAVLILRAAAVPVDFVQAQGFL
jgi:hypothetical protein